MFVAQQTLVVDAMKFDARHIVCEGFVRISLTKVLSKDLLPKTLVISNFDAATVF